MRSAQRVHVRYTVVCAWCALYAHHLYSVRLPAQLAHMPHAALCCLLAPAKPARQDTRRGCVQSQAATAGALLEPRPLANACLCEALGTQARGSFDFCAVLLKNNTAGLATVDRAGKRQQPQPDVSRRSWTWSIRCRSCSTFRAPNSHRRGTAGGQEAHTRGILPFGTAASRGPTASPGPTGAKIRQKCGTIPFRFNYQMLLSETQPADLISEPLLLAARLQAEPSIR